MMQLPVPFQTFAEAIDYLYSFINWDVARHVRNAPEAITLDRPRTLLSAYGNPQDKYPVVHLTGTKGKGSVGAMCAAAFQAAGLKVGLYSSPHLQDFRERFRINNQLVEEDDFTALVNEMRPVIDTIPDITWFEVVTGLAFLYFARQAVDVAVIEVGLGGRLDATNVVTPVVSVITSLSFDHTHLLGDSLASIAWEKAGIIKPGVPIVSAPQPPEALEVLAATAAERSAPLTLVGRDWLYTAGESSWEGQHFVAGPAGTEPEAYCTALIGEHQALNATVALAALEHARQAGLPLSREAMQRGLRSVDWPGRLEIVEQRPLVILDAAHNADSARRLAAALGQQFSQGPKALVFGASSDKDVGGMFDALLPHASVLIASQAVHSRAMSPDAIESVARSKGYEGSVWHIPAAAEALAKAAELVGPDGLVCVTGSLFIVGEMRTVLGLPVGHVVPVRQKTPLRVTC